MTTIIIPANTMIYNEQDSRAVCPTRIDTEFQLVDVEGQKLFLRLSRSPYLYSCYQDKLGAA